VRGVLLSWVIYVPVFASPDHESEGVKDGCKRE
jgi:hypothetical protein